MTSADVKRLRRRLGLTQRALAARLGVHQLTVSRWECDRVRVTEPMARLLRLLVTTAPTTKGGRRR
jgi:DNA-binding transcriptional regulator YiaG